MMGRPRVRPPDHCPQWSTTKQRKSIPVSSILAYTRLPRNLHNQLVMTVYHNRYPMTWAEVLTSLHRCSRIRSRVLQFLVAFAWQCNNAWTRARLFSVPDFRACQMRLSYVFAIRAPALPSVREFVFSASTDGKADARRKAALYLLQRTPLRCPQVLAKRQRSIKLTNSTKANIYVAQRLCHCHDGYQRGRA